MVNEEPDISLRAVFNVKETCAILDICKDTLRDRRRKQMIVPVDPEAKRGFKFSGRAIRNFWKIESGTVKLL